MDVLTAHIRHAQDDDLRCFICVAHHYSPVLQRMFVSIGSSMSPAGARADLLRIVREHGVNGHTDVRECVSAQDREALLTAAKDWAEWNEVPFEVISLA